ncbi:MAG: PKD domain-containing protein [Phaeodactylibacter sp.]|uniref:PKD domain-containing protein n=1 Tax=Phaeodactylibacter sp. TaxID=1940289 RepID=UPI0032EF83DC
MAPRIYFSFLILMAWCVTPVLAQDTADRFDESTWSVDPANYPNSMVITAVIDIEGEESMDPNDRVAAFTGNSNGIRGVSNPAYVAALDRYIVSLFVYSVNGAQDDITFQVYDASTDVVLPCTTTELFSTNKTVGSFAQPDTIFTVRIQANFTKDDVLCAADTFGFAQANVIGGLPPYEYLWSNGATNDRIDNIGQGRYYLTITDDNGFAKVDSVDILNLNREILAPVLAAAPEDTLCAGQDVYLFSFSAETEMPAYEWYDNFGNFLQEGQSLFLPDIAFSRELEVFTNVRNCLSAPTSIDIEVLPVPSAAFTLNNAAPSVQDTVIFTPEVNDGQFAYAWNFGDGNTSTMPMPSHAYTIAGNYVVALEITTADGCTNRTEQYLSVGATGIDVLFSQESPACDDDPSGSITAQAINGAPPYTYAWENGSTGTTLEGLLPGAYSLTVTDAQGNEREAEFTLTAAGALAAPVIIANGNGQACAGDDVALAAFSERPGAEIRWYGDAAGAQLLYTGSQLTLYGLSSSQQLWAEARIGGCTSPLTPANIEIPDIEAGFSIDVEALPLGEATTFQAAAQQAGYVYTWSFGDGNGATGPGPHDHAYLLSGTFEVTLQVESPEGCTTTSSRFVNVWGGALQLLPVVSEASCAGDDSGSVSLQIQGGQGPYTYAWSNGSAQPSLDGLLPGTYSVTITDSNGLSASVQATVGAELDGPAPPAVIVNGGNAICTGGDAWATAYSQDDGVVFYWYPTILGNNPVFVGSTFLLFGVEESDTYYVEARNGDCISDRTPVNIQVNNPDARFTASLEVVYPGTPIQFSALNTNLGTILSWDWGDNSPNGQFPDMQHTYAEPGIYEVKLTAIAVQSGCQAEEVIRIQVVSAPDGGSGGGNGAENLLALPLSEPARCQGSPSGTLSAYAIGGTPPYSYNWSNGNTEAYQNGVNSGAYFLTVTDSEGNSAVGAATVGALDELEPPLAVVNGGQPACPGEELWIAAANQHSGLSYFWYADSLGQEVLYAGAYIQAQGNDLLDTLYLQARADGCTSDLTPITVQYEPIEANFSVSAPTASVDDEITFSVETTAPGATYAWSFGDGTSADGALSTHSYPQTGLYEVALTVTSASGCSAQQRRFVNVYEAPAGQLSAAFALEYPFCPEDATGAINTLVFGGQPPYTFDWADGASGNVRTGLSTGTYAVTVTDANGNTAVASTSLPALVPQLPAPDAGQAQSGPVCLGGTAWLASTADVSGAQFYWYDSPVGGSPMFIGSYLELNEVAGAQAYFVETQYQGCVSDTRTPVFVEVESADAAFSASPIATVAGEAITFVAQDGPGDQSYSWSFGDGNSAGGFSAMHAYNSPGFFTVALEATTENGCSAASSQIVQILPGGGLQLAIEAQGPACPDATDGTLALSITGGAWPFTIEWSDGSAEAERSGLQAGTYEVTVTDGLGNTASAQAELNSPAGALAAPAVTVSGGTCPGSTVSLIAGNNPSQAFYLWYDAPVDGNLIFAGSTFPFGPVSATDTVYVEAKLGNCTSSRAMVEVVVEGPNAGFTYSPADILAGDVVSFTPEENNPGYTYAWAFGDGSTSADATPVNTYTTDNTFLATLTVTDESGCSVSGTQAVPVGFGQALGIQLEAVNTQCSGGSDGAVAALVFNGAGPYTFEWSNGASGPALQNISAGLYSVTVTDAEGVSAVAQATVGSNVPPLAAPQAASNNDVICGDGFLLLYAYDNTGSANTFYWYNSATGNDLLGSGPTYSQQGLAGAAQTFFVEAAAGTCRSGVRTPITIEAESPNEGFTVSASTVTTGNTVSFSPINGDASFDYLWSFGDGTVSTQMSPVHTYSAPGQYTVSLQAESPSGCSQTVEEPAFVEVVAQGALSVSLNISQPACAGEVTGTVEATLLNGTPPFEYAWSTGSTAEVLVAVPAGQYAVTITDGEGNVAQKSFAVNALFPTPNIPNIELNTSLPLCNGENVLLTAFSGQVVDQYFWYDNNGTLLGAGNSYLAVASGDSLKLQAQAQRGSCFSALASEAFEVEAVDASFTVAGNAQAGESLSFQANTAGYQSYTWDFGDGNTSAGTTVQHTYQMEGNYAASLVVESLAGCASSAGQNLAIASENQLALLFDTKDVLCAESSAGTAAVAVQGGTAPYNYSWSNGESGAGIGNLEAGLYQVTVTDAEGLAIAGTAEIVNLNATIPQPAVNANGGAVVCKNEPAFFTASVPGYPGAGVNWYESLSQPSPSAQGAVFVSSGYASNAVLYAEAVVEGCLSNTLQYNVNVQAPEAGFAITPEGTLDEGSLVQFLPSAPENGNTYYWQFGDGGWSTAMEPFYFYNLPGMFDVSLEVTDTDGCTNNEMAPEFVEVLPYQGFGPGLDERSSQLQGSSEMSGTVFPVPFRSSLTAVLVAKEENQYSISLADAFGRTLFQEQLEIGPNPRSWQLSDVSHLPAGVYYLRIQGQGQHAITKIVKQ